MQIAAKWEFINLREWSANIIGLESILQLGQSIFSLRASSSITFFIRRICTAAVDDFLNGFNFFAVFLRAWNRIFWNEKFLSKRIRK